MKPYTQLFCFKTLYLPILLVFCFCLGSPAWAQAAQPPRSDFLVYCLIIEEGHPDEALCGEWFDSLTAEERHAFQEWRDEEDYWVWDSMVDRAGLISVERGGTPVSAESRVLSVAGTIIITGAAVSAGAVGGLVIYIETANCGWDSSCEATPTALLPFAGALLGGVVGVAISRQIWRAPDDPRNAPLSVAPYLHENASGVMFSGGF
jgi:hypothetical protein